jgi:D-3-phosphoglycerate dehydrogenase / 2-oxoglutarate reductase
MPRVLICDSLETSGAEVLQRAGLEVDNRPGLKGDALKEAIRAADGAIVRSATKITADILEQPGHLRAIARAGVGVDNIDVAAATRHGIVVMNTPGGNTISAAEHTIALILALARQVPAADASMRGGKWERSRFMGSQLAGKTLGIIGMGRIGREVARRAAGLDLHVIGFDPFVTPDRAAQMNIAAVHNLDVFLPRCDFLSVHTPLTDETRDLIGAAEIAKLKPGCRVINVARGGIINEAAVAAALQAGALAGAGFDVFEKEPPPADSPLLAAPNVILTPHLGASTVEAQDAVAREAAQLLVDYLTRGVVQFAVNLAALDRAELEELRLYFDLARRLGLLHAQMVRGTIQETHLTCRGEIAHRNTRLITAAYVAGLLANRGGSVNVVNAEVLAREGGIAITESAATKSGDFGSMLLAEVVTDKKKYTAAGTLFGNQYFRLVQLGPHRLDAYLDGVLLILTHRDRPGLIGYIGTVFGQHGVNIAQMTVGRQEIGGEAIAVLNLDSAPPDAAIAAIEQNENISSVRVVRLPPAGQVADWVG